MVFSLLIGIILGALSVIFALQNVAVITVTFLAWQITGPLAIILLATLISGVVITLLVLLPNLLKDDMYLTVLKQQKKELEDELAKHKQASAAPLPSPPSQIA